MEKQKNGVGRRKEAVTRVFISKGDGKITVNDKDYKTYFPLVYLQNQVERPRLERLEAEIRMEMDHLMGILFYTTNKPERTEVLQKLVHASKRLNILYKELNRPHGTYNKQIRIK